MIHNSKVGGSIPPPRYQTFRLYFQRRKCCNDEPNSPLSCVDHLCGSSSRSRTVATLSRRERQRCQEDAERVTMESLANRNRYLRKMFYRPDTIISTGPSTSGEQGEDGSNQSGHISEVIGWERSLSFRRTSMVSLFSRKTFRASASTAAGRQVKLDVRFKVSAMYYNGRLEY